eukprot:3553385-Prymnesium_polylepis.1
MVPEVRAAAVAHAAPKRAVRTRRVAFAFFRFARLVASRRSAGRRYLRSGRVATICSALRADRR